MHCHNREDVFFLIRCENVFIQIQRCGPFFSILIQLYVEISVELHYWIDFWCFSSVSCKIRTSTKKKFFCLSWTIRGRLVNWLISLILHTFIGKQEKICCVLILREKISKFWTTLTFSRWMLAQNRISLQIFWCLFSTYLFVIKFFEVFSET